MKKNKMPEAPKYSDDRLSDRKRDILRNQCLLDLLEEVKSMKILIQKLTVSSDAISKVLQKPEGIEKPEPEVFELSKPAPKVTLKERVIRPPKVKIAVLNEKKELVIKEEKKPVAKPKKKAPPEKPKPKKRGRKSKSPASTK